MNEEEKEAIKKFKNFIYTYQEVIENEYSDYEEKESAKEYQEVSEKLLKLIEKQQKEIDFFRNNNCCFESTEQGLYAIQLKPENYVPKDKIKEKIKELKNRKIGASTGIFAVQVDILEELLRG